MLEQLVKIARRRHRHLGNVEQRQLLEEARARRRHRQAKQRREDANVRHMLILDVEQLGEDRRAVAAGWNRERREQNARRLLDRLLVGERLLHVLVDDILLQKRRRVKQLIFALPKDERQLKRAARLSAKQSDGRTHLVVVIDVARRLDHATIFVFTQLHYVVQILGAFVRLLP